MYNILKSQDQMFSLSSISTPLCLVLPWYETLCYDVLLMLRDKDIQLWYISVIFNDATNPSKL